MLLLLLLCSYEHAGENPKTLKKYLHVVHIWAAFCLERGIYGGLGVTCLKAGGMPLLSSYTHMMLVGHCLSQKKTIESYLTMLSHVLIMMQRVQRKGMGDRQRDYMHASQRDRIQKVVTEFCDVHPECRVVPNTKSAWDDVLVNAAMQMLLVWCVYGHCCLNNPAWPAFARMCMVMLSYQGSREIFFVFANLVVVAFDPSVTTTESLKSLRLTLEAPLPFARLNTSASRP